MEPNLKVFFDAERKAIHKAFYAQSLEHVNILNIDLFKRVLGTEQNKHLAIDFLNCFFQSQLGHAIVDLEILDVYAIPQRITEKFICYELELDSHEKVNLELQIANKRNKDSFAVYCLRISPIQFCDAEPEFKEERATFIFNVLDFSLSEDSNTPFTSTPPEKTDIYPCPSSVRSVNYLELPKVRISDDLSKLSRTDKWLAFLSNEILFSKKEQVALTDPVIKQACDEVKKYMDNSLFFFLYIVQESNGRDENPEDVYSFKSGFEQGFYQGYYEEGWRRVVETYTQIVLNLLKEGMELSFIREMTGASDDEIKTIAKERGLQVN